MYTVLNGNLQVKGKLTLNNGRGSTAFFNDTIKQQMATDNSNTANNVSLAFNELDKQGNTKQWGHSLELNVEATDLGTSITTSDYILYFDSVAVHYYLMKVLDTDTDRNSGYIKVNTINAAIYELGKIRTENEKSFTNASLQTVVSDLYRFAPFSIQISSNIVSSLNYTVPADTSLQATLQDLQTKYDVDADSWVELDSSGNIADRVVYFGTVGSNNGELIRYGGAKGFENMSAQEVSDTIYTKLYVKGQTESTDPQKGSIASVNNGMTYITDDAANQVQYPIGASQEQPVYLEGSITNTILSEPIALLSWAKAQMKIFNHPRFNYTVTPLHDQIVGIGDTIRVQDFHIKPSILVESKVIQKTTSFASPESNTFVLGEFSSIFTENANKGAGIIELIKKDVTVVQEAADNARISAEEAHKQAVLAQEQAIQAQTTANGKSTAFTVNSLSDLPATANNGDIAWVTDASGTYGYTYIDGKWVEDISPHLKQDITDGVNNAITTATVNATKLVNDNAIKINKTISDVDAKANQLKIDQATFDTKAQGYADNALANAKSNTATIAQQTAENAQAAINQAKADIQAKDGQQDTRIGTIETSVDGVKSDFGTYKTSNDGAVKTAQTTAQIAVDGLKTKVSQTDYNAKTGDLSTKVSTAQQTADSAVTTIGNYQTTNDKRVTATETAIKQNSDSITLSATKQELNDANATTNYRVYLTENNVSSLKVSTDSISATVSKLSDGTDSRFTTVNQTVSGVASTVSDQGKSIDSVTSRVQTAEGNISKATDNINGLSTKMSQTANQISQEVTDRNSGDNNTLQSAKDFTSSQISNSESGTRSLINQKADSVTVGAIQNDVSGLKSAVNWQQITFDDVDYLKGTGNYLVTDGAGHNSPFTPWFYIKVDQPRGDRVTQTTWKDVDSTLYYTRTFNGDSWSPWNQVVTNSTLMNIFNDSWSVGSYASDGITNKLITGINGTPDGTLIVKGRDVILDGNTQVTGDFKVNSANIASGSIGYAQIGSAVIDSSKIISLDVSKLTGSQINGINFNVGSGGRITSSDNTFGVSNNDFFFKGLGGATSSYTSPFGTNIWVGDIKYCIDSDIGEMNSVGTINTHRGNSDNATGQVETLYSPAHMYIHSSSWTDGDADHFALLLDTGLTIADDTIDQNSAKSITRVNSKGITTKGDITANGTVNAYSSLQTPYIYANPNLFIESKNQSVVLKAGNMSILQIRENGYMYLLKRNSGSGGTALKIASDGGIFMQSSSTKYKTDIQYDGSTSVGDKLLTLDPVTWQDKGDYEQRETYRKKGIEPDHKIYMEDKRYYGLIAEDLVKAGLEEFVIRDDDTGSVEGLEYDKIAISLIPLVREQRNAINELKLEVERLKEKIK